jgi:hypothetical protein
MAQFFTPDYSGPWKFYPTDGDDHIGKWIDPKQNIADYNPFKNYWKAKGPTKGGWKRYDPEGKPIDNDTAHQGFPNPKPEPPKEGEGGAGGGECGEPGEGGGGGGGNVGTEPGGAGDGGGEGGGGGNKEIDPFPD